MVDDSTGFETDDIPPASDILRKTKTLLAASGAQQRQGRRASAARSRLHEWLVRILAIGLVLPPGLTREIDNRAASGIAPSLASSRMLR